MVALLISVAILPITTNAGQKPPVANNNAPENATLRQAEAAADRIVHRFHETLDFNNIFADEFVAEPKLRAQAVAFGDPDRRKRFDAATNEHFYAVLMTYLHLWEEYMLIQNANEAPPEMRKLKLSMWNSTAPKTQAELNRAIVEVESVSAIFRKYLPQSAFRDPIYRENIRSERERAFHRVPRIEKGSREFGIPKTIPVYVVRPEVFDYYFVQEKGVMKLFYVNILPNGLGW
jgi:hypothetical protein